MIECQVKTIKNFLNHDDCERIIYEVTRFKDWPVSSDEFWDNRVMSSPYIRRCLDEGIADLIDLTALRIARFIEEMYCLDKRIYPDALDVVRWFPEMKQPIHCDDMSGTGVHGFYHRMFGAIIYLNDDYEGGKTVYPEWGMEVQPEVGMLAVHLGNHAHRHGVTRVKNSPRYTIASFWTVDQERNICRAFNTTQ